MTHPHPSTDVEEIVEKVATPLIMDMSWINKPDYGEHLKSKIRQALTTQATTHQATLAEVVKEAWIDGFMATGEGKNGEYCSGCGGNYVTREAVAEIYDEEHSITLTDDKPEEV